MSSRGRERWWARRVATIMTDERGAGMVEVTLAVALTGVALVTLLSGMSMGSVALGTSEERLVAENLARSQVEYARSQPFQAAPSTYLSVPAPAGYGVTATASALPEGDANIQLLTVTVTRDAAPLFALESYRVNR